MRLWRIWPKLGFAFLFMVLLGCQALVDDFVGKKPEDVQNIRITMVAKSASNPVFLSARVGAEAAAEDLSEKYSKINVDIDWRTPLLEDATGQVERILNAVNDGTDAILVSCSDEEILAIAINQAVERGVPVMTFDSDAPNSNRFAFYGPDDQEIGERIMTELISLMGDEGQVAILGGNPNAPNLRKRVEGVQNEGAKYPGIEVVGTFYHEETAEDATEMVIEVNKAYPNLKGWAMIGGWPLFSETLMPHIDPEKIKIVAVDALPVQLPYVEKGIVPILLGQPTFKWGKICVEKIIDKIHLDKDVEVINRMKLIRVSKENLGGWARQLRAWGYEGIPRKYLSM